MPWGQSEKDQWFKEQKIQRSYQTEVVYEIRRLRPNFELIQYGALTMDPEKYPLFLVQSKSFDPKKKTALITGGVHGYETSGVRGAIEFLESSARDYERDFNILCAPCVSPVVLRDHQSMETRKLLTPNRSFRAESPIEESRFLYEALRDIKPFVHIDLHETTDTDNSVFRPALELRDGIKKEFSEIPDGFYVVGDSENPQPAFQKAIVDAVRTVTHIAQADAAGKLIGDRIEQEGVINYPVKKLFLCAGLTDAPYATTTEVYPDSPRTTPANCVAAQVVAIRAALDYVARV